MPSSLEHGSATDTDTAKAVRRATFPENEASYNGTTIWRCLIPLASVAHLSITKYTAFHHGPQRTFKCSVVSSQDEIDAGKGLWEMTLRAFEDPGEAQTKGVKKYSWGVPASNERVASHFKVSRRLYVPLYGRPDLEL